MNAPIRSGINAGITFGIISVFLVLIGFHATAADLIGSALNYKTGDPVFGLTPLMIDMLVLFAVLAFLAGIQGARKVHTGRIGHALLSSVLAGATAGLMTGLLALVLGTLAANNVQITKYFQSLIPGTVQLFRLGTTPVNAAIIYFLMFIIWAALGGLITFTSRRSQSEGAMKGLFTRSSDTIRSSSVYRSLASSKATRWILYGLLILALFLIPLGLGDYWNYTVGTVGIYVLLGLGLNIVVGLAGLLDLGYVAFFAIGAYTVALLTAPEPHNLQWNFWLVLPLGVALAALAGILLGIPVLRMRGDYLAIVTLGFGEIIRILSRSDLLSNFSGGPKGVRDVAKPEMFGEPFGSNLNFVWMIIVAVLLIIFVTNRLKNSRVGRAWVAMREDETVARANGINILTHKLLAFAIGAAFAGLGGVLFASRNAFTGPEDHNLMVSINVLSLVIVGGMGSIPGVITGAFVLKGLPEILRQLENYRLLAFGALLVVMMIIRPEGIIPSARRKLELAEKEEIEPPPAHPESTETDMGTENNLPEGEAPV